MGWRVAKMGYFGPISATYFFYPGNWNGSVVAVRASVEDIAFGSHTHRRLWEMMMFNKKVGLALAALVLAPVTAHAQAAPAAFSKCVACHKVEAGKHGVGPSLAGVFGKKAGAAEGYKYSDAHKASGVTWDEATLAKYLADPKGTIPGNKMVFAGLKDANDVKAVIDYLKTLK